MNRRRWLLGLAPGLVIGAFFLLPLVYAVAYAFGLDDGRPLTQTIRDIAQSAYHRNRIAFTFTQAIASTGLTLAVGLPLAYVFAFHDFRGKRALKSLLTVPFVLPALVVALALQASLGPRGPLGDLFGWDLLGLLGPLGAILVAHVYYEVSLVLRIVGAAWERVPTTQIEAARTLGATPGQLMRRVLLPLASPAILSASALCFLFTATSFGVILLLAAPRAGTVETLLYEEVATLPPRYDLAAVLGLLQLATTFLALLAYLHFHRRAAARLTPRLPGPRPRLTGPSRLAVYATVALAVAPTLLLLDAALRDGAQLQLDGFRLLWSREAPLGSYTINDVLLNSARFALLTAAIAVPLALLQAYAFRGASTRARFVEATLLTPLGTSAVLVGFGFLLAYDGQPLWDLRAHPARILLAHVLVAFPFATRILAPAIEGLDPVLRDAARTLGANARQAFARVELPLLRPSIRAALVFAIAASLGEFGATLVLRRPEYTTIPLALYDAVGRPGLLYREQAYALATLLMIAAALSFWLVDFGRGRNAQGEPW